MAAGTALPWTAIARLDAKPTPSIALLASREGVSTLVLDTGILLNSNLVYGLPGTADQFVTVPDALEEIRDPAARAQLAALPFKLLTAEPSQDALSKVVQFARATGDVHTLSNVDLRLLALTYMLEVEAHGSSHLRAQPPPLQFLPKATLKHRDPPGWGNNVPNPEEWEEMDRLEDQALHADGGRQSRILDLQTLSLDFSEQPADVDAVDKLSGLKLADDDLLTDANLNVRNLPPSVNLSEDSSAKPLSARGRRNRRKVPHHMAPVQLEAKLMVSVGVDATKGHSQEDAGEWEKACSRSTRRKHQKRAARCVGMDAHREGDGNSIAGSSDPKLPALAQQQLQDRAGDEIASRVLEEEEEDDDLPELLNIDDVPELLDLEEVEDDDIRSYRASQGGHADRDGDVSATGHNHGCMEEQFNEEDVASENNVDSLTSAAVDDIDSDESPTGDPGFQSSIACMTADYAMQNVLLQIGLRLVSAGGLQVQELHRWVLKCQACNHVTADAGRLFCPKCGNGGTLYRMSVTVGTNGLLHAGRQRRVNLRGTKYSLPLPKGGREGAVQNPILCEDQLPLPRRLSNSKTKKVSFSEGPDCCDAGDVFTKNVQASARRGQNLGNAAAIFSGRRNPNERRVTRRH